jgi:hypothetical protein
MNQQKTLYSNHISHQKQGKANKKDMQVARSISCTSHHEPRTSHREPPAGHQDVNLETKKIRQLTCSANKTKKYYVDSSMPDCLEKTYRTIPTI